MSGIMKNTDKRKRRQWLPGIEPEASPPTNPGLTGRGGVTGYLGRLNGVAPTPLSKSPSVLIINLYTYDPPLQIDTPAFGGRLFNN